MSSSLNKIYKDVISASQRFKKIEAFRRGLLGLFCGYLFFSLALLIDLNSVALALFVSIALSVFIFIFSSRVKFIPFTQNEMLLRLELQHPNLAQSPLAINDFDADAPEELSSILAGFFQEHKKQLKTHSHIAWSRLFIPATLCLVLHFISPATQALLSLDLQSLGASWRKDAELVIHKGDEDNPNSEVASKITLSFAKPAWVNLASDNLLELLVIGVENMPAPVVELRELGFKADQTKKIPELDKLKLFQSFRLSRNENLGNGRVLYSIKFSVEKSVALIVPFLSENKPVAVLQLNTPPLPEVELSVLNQLRSPWPDHLPLNLNIKVSAKNPLDKIEIKIYSGKTENSELVNKVMAQELFEYEGQYELILESYLNSDLAEFSLVAEASDRGLPQALVGRSKPITITVASAYGRYRQTLQSLRELKTILDEKIATQDGLLSTEASEIIKRANEQALDSPFFDGLDRLNVTRFATNVEELNQQANIEKLLDLSQDLNQFLLEHELIDDRERDRDFFVATRSLSRLLEKKVADRKTSLERMATSLNSFLEDRYKRWELRVNRLPKELQPNDWPKVKNKVFNAKLQKVVAADKQSDVKDRDQAFAELSALVNDYRAWIEQLEAQEDAHRAQQEAQRQQGLASAQDSLQEIRKRQAKISQRLDQAQNQQIEQLKNNWGADRLEQNTNIGSTRKLEAQMRALSPPAAARIKAAAEQMQATVDAAAGGEKQSFVMAESHSDLAGRLLVQAQQAAEKNQRQQGQQRGKRRRVTGDNYYGNNLMEGGEIEIIHEYEVDRMFREDVLDQVSTSDYLDKDEELYRAYLQEVIR
ncbi:MAG: hypothetical protein KBD78_00310 [Oligoflexales bacterium]|nr:hypothetical protein [Oligoflexales bacterium]